MNWLQVDDRDEVRRLTIDNPDRKNAVPFDGWSDLLDAFTDFESSAARVLVVTGANGEFCAGADLDLTGSASMLSVVDRHARMKLIERTATALHRTTKPTIAAVDGVAVGAGMNLALGCDIVIATDRARFSEIFVRRGLSIDFGGSWLLPRIVGLQRAKELALSGRIIGAEEALSIGLVLEVVPPEDLPARAQELADSLLKGAPIAQAMIKQGLNASFESSFAESVSWEGQSQAIAFGTEDVAEGIGAFLQKRDPEWKGR
ncbi:MAG: enoyl-CoA hydratase-related protein [Actinomycetota bacterium]|nr:enoyl-CoA hydratase-related protein [Actinomycetota bacterium]